MNQEESPNTLYVPVNIKVRFEFIAGFGFSELGVTLIVSGLAGLCVLIANMFSNDPYNAVLAVSVTAAATGMAVRKNDMNQSVTDMALLFWKFAQTQQRFPYIHFNGFTGNGGH